jgi:nucleolar protein 15
MPGKKKMVTKKGPKLVGKVKKETMVSKEKSKEKKMVKSVAKTEEETEDGGSRGVIVLHNIPHGFYEKEMYGYFRQFGAVTKLRMSRSSKTGKSRGYAYIEFAVDEVAKIVAETMDNYLMFEHKLTCKYIPPEKVHPKIFFKWNDKRVNTVTRHKALVNRDLTFENERKLITKRLQKIRRVERKLEQLGIGFKCVLVNDPLKDKSMADIVVDSGDDEVTFKTPPTTRKVSKKTKRPLHETPKSTPKKTPTLEMITIKPQVSKSTTPSAPSSAGKRTPAKKLKTVATPAKNSMTVTTSAKKLKPVAATPKNSPSSKPTPKKRSGLRSSKK